jgi:hypothetical protein
LTCEKFATAFSKENEKLRFLKTYLPSTGQQSIILQIKPVTLRLNPVYDNG